MDKKIKTRKSYFAVVVLLMSFSLQIDVKGQEISVNPDSFEQEFLGTGASCGLYMGHYLSMSEENQLKASRMQYEDLKLNYIKNYQGNYPWDSPSSYDNIVIAINNARKYNPNTSVVICANNLPNHLEEIDKHGDPKKGEHDNSIPGIMDSVANYYFHVCKGYHDRGITVDILELVNERGYKDGKVTDLFDIATDKFKAMMNDSSINTTSVPMPLIAGPSPWSAKAPKTFIEGWKADRPNAWNNVDIVTTHGYQNGTESSYQGTFDVSEGKLFYQSEQTGKLQRDELKGVDVIAEQFPDEYPEFVPNAGIARHMMDFFNGGGNAFFCFLSNNPKGNNPCLLGTKWGGEPFESTIYYGFKHLSATHPLHSRRVNRDLTDMENYKAVSFRKQDEDTVYVHFTNLYNTHDQVTVDFTDYGIKSVEAWTTDEFRKFEKVVNETYSSSRDKLVLSVTPYSVHTLKAVIDSTGWSVKMQSQTITFNAISDKIETDQYYILSATSSAGLTVQYEVTDGPATISGDTAYFNGAGNVSIKAFHPGNDTLLASKAVTQSFCVKPQKPVITVDGNTLTSSSSSGNQWLLNNSTISGATGKTYNAAITGNYKVQVSIDGCFNTSDEVSLTVTGLDENLMESPYLIHIDNGILTIRQTGNLKVKQIILYSLSGTKLIEKSGISSSEVKLGVDDIYKGLYLLKVIDEKGDSFVQKVLRF